MKPSLNRYVTAGAGGGGMGLAGSEWTLSEAMTNATAYRSTATKMTRLSNWAYIDDTGHGLETGDVIKLTTTDPEAAAFNGVHQVTKVNANQYKYPNTGTDDPDGFLNPQIRASMAVWIKAGNYILTGGLTVAGSGNLEENLTLSFIGYNTTSDFWYMGVEIKLSDMDRGKGYYQSIRDAYVNGVDTNSFVNIDADDGAFTIVTINGVDGIVFRNLYFHNNSEGSGFNGLKFISTPIGCLLDHCAVSHVRTATGGAATGFTINDCLFFSIINARPLSHDGIGSRVLNSIIKNDSGIPWFIPTYGDSWLVEGCVIIGGRGFGARGTGIFRNNISYNQYDYGFGTSDDAGVYSVYNNIFCMQDENQPAILHDRLDNGSGGTILYNDYNYFWGVDGKPLLNALNSNHPSAVAPRMGYHSDWVDPDFVDAANGDFKPRNPEVLWGGMPDIGGDVTAAGAVGQKYQFAARGRMANPGRLGIIR